MSIDVALTSHTFLTDLDSHTRGDVLTPGMPGFNAAVAPFNRATSHRPDAVLVAADVSDVVAGIRAAVRHGRRVAVQATGHGAAATGPGTLLVSSRLLNDVQIDPAARTATVGAGTIWQQVLDAAAPHGLAALCGSAPHVGVVGYTLGGGLGPVARTFGFAADHVLAMDIVTADGTVRTVSSDHEPDLFDALCGGGGAFGVVVAMTFRLFEVRTLYAGGAFYSLDVARTVLHHWREWCLDLPDEVSTSVARVNLPPDPLLPEPLRGRAVVHLRYAHVGDPVLGAALVAPLLEVAPPLLVTLDEIPYAAVGSVHADPVQPMPVVEGGLLLRELPGAAIERFLEVTSPGAGLPLAVTEIRLLGGALRRSSHANAVAGRGAAFHVHPIAVPAGPGDAAAAEECVRAVHEQLRAWTDGEVLMNFAGAAGPATRAALHRTWGDDAVAGLSALRERVDPVGVFDPMARW
jgi:FAD/FMN-containing dehydrogenase